MSRVVAFSRLARGARALCRITGAGVISALAACTPVHRGTSPDAAVAFGGTDTYLAAAPAPPPSPSPMLALETSIAAWEVPPDPNAAVRPPSHAYGRMDADTCERTLTRRGVPYARMPSTPGVERPIRLTGRLHGVDFHTEPASRRARSPYEILDCRLALALDDFAAIVSRYGVVEVVHMSMYRPPPKGSRARKKRSQHEAGLAIDVGSFVRADGAKLVVEKDWHGAIGSKTCGEDAQPRIVSSESMALRGILCSAADAHIFQLLLTPNHDERHFNHFHLEVVRNATWFILK